MFNFAIRKVAIFKNMSVLIADSGATKTEWCLVTRNRDRDQGKKCFKTEGLNPYYHTPESIREVVKSVFKKLSAQEAIEQIFFYGAGCDNDTRKNLFRNILSDCFPRAGVSVFHDLLGAARACFYDRPGIACILGTGSNSCLYDGEKITEHIPSLAFILGDEGSAGYFGKKLINSYFRREIPEELRGDLEADYNMSLDHIMEGTYHRSQRSRFIGSYASFLEKNRNHPYIRKLLNEGFEEFITRIVIKYSGSTEVKVSFVGSIAYIHRELILNILNDQGLIPGIFIQKPMKRLINYHTQKKN